MKEPVSVINIEEDIGKTVGKRRPPRDPLKTADALQKAHDEFRNLLGHRYGARGVFRFKTHEEANEWTRKMTRPNKS